MKVILGNSNTVWGVIIRPQSSNAYRNILSFDSQQLKDDFINQYIMKGLDYKTELKNSNNRAVVEIDALTIDFRVNADEYPYETFESLLNKDFCITQDEHKKIKFYAITDAKRIGNIIEYQAEIDIFFTYDIKNEIFNDTSETMISRGMEDRFVKDSNGQIDWFLKDPNYDFKSTILNPESFDSLSEKGLIPVDKPKEIYFDYSPYWKGGTDGWTDKIKNFYNSILNTMVWDVLGWNQTTKKYEPFSGLGETKEPYAILSAYGGAQIDQNKFMEKYKTDIDHSPSFNKFRIRLAITTKAGNATHIFYDNVNLDLDSTHLMKSSRTQTFIPPWFATENLSPDNFQIDEVNFHNEKIINVSIIVENDEFTRLKNFRATQSAVSTKVQPASDIGLSLFHEAFGTINGDEHDKYALVFNVLKLNPMQYEFQSDIKILPDAPSAISINDVVAEKHFNEIKSYLAPYRTLKLKTISDNEKDLSPQAFTQLDKLKVNMDYMYLVETWQTRINILNYLNQYQPNFSNDTRENIFFNDMTTYQRATSVNAYEEWIVRNKSQFQTGLLTNKVNAGMGAIGAAGGAAASGASGNPIGALGSLFGGVSLAVNSALKINQQMSLIKDLKNTPNEMIGTGSTLIADNIYKRFNGSITEYKLQPNLDLLVKEHFYKYGYDLNNKIAPIKKYLNNRYYFNYIEAPETFENISLQASASTKQIINDSLASGLTIWHVRDLNTFKGIKSYKHENLEMSIK